ncbi:two-component system response regulator [Neptunomonas japonica]|uniref:two-component system response regulator n=1 Tax=Neptunomonas japonica TaxID=417574 RepID=UPI0004264990|nr:EAL domain-containing protein [Neptunomonas japonica]
MSKSDMSYTVLIVDDDPGIRLLMKYALQDEDLTIFEAENGDKALQVFQEVSPDIVLLDVSMPGMTGFECCQQLRNSNMGAQCAIVMVTALDKPEDIEAAFEVGATDFMTKPLKWPLFNHRVRYILKANKTLLALSRNQSKLSKAQSIARLGYWEWDFKSPFIECSTELFSMLDIQKMDDAVMYRSVLKCIHPEDRRIFNDAFRQALHENKSYDIEYRVVRSDGEVIIFHDRTDIIEEYGHKRIIGTLHDITSQKNTEREISYYAYYDTLTKLPNRRLFLDQFETSLATAKRRHEEVSLLFIDLDHFKNINDSYGHHVGDQVLTQTASRIKNSVCMPDAVTIDIEGSQNKVARLAGDEFTVLLCEVNAVDNVVTIAQRVLDSLSQPFLLDNHTIHITATIGIALYPDDSDNVQELLQNADVAMYHAKESGRNSYQFFSEELNVYHKNRLSIESGLRSAMLNNELVIYYQPQFSGEPNEIIGFEALLRWDHPTKGLLSPDKFMNVAEASGLIVPIGGWVLEQACKQAHEWSQRSTKPYRMAVNLSALQFNHKNLSEQVLGALEVSGLDPSLLELEITESAIIQNINETLALLVSLKSLGINLAIDDFGTGYSSLSYLKNFPIDTLKVDKSFIDEIVTSKKDAAIAQTILQLADNLGLLSVAEGVETKEQVAGLTDMGCTQFQGYYFSKPLPVELIDMLID